MSTVTKLKAGRTWSVNDKGIDTLTREYVVCLDSITTENGEGATFTGVPAIGSAHPVHSSLFVDHYDVEEGSSTDKKTIRVKVVYQRESLEDVGTGEEEEIISVERWGWDAATAEKDLTEDTLGNKVVNSAQDPFDNVPKVKVFAPSFTKVYKTKSRDSSALSFNCKVNSKAVTIGSITCAIGTLICSVAEENLINDATWKYRYTVTLRYLTNKVVIEQGNDPIEIGWDAAVLDCGMRQYSDTGDGSKELIRIPDPVTKVPATISSPALLNGAGRALLPASTTDVVKPYYFRFRPYESAEIPSVFYSEPNTEGNTNGN